MKHTKKFDAFTRFKRGYMKTRGHGMLPEPTRWQIMWDAFQSGVRFGERDAKKKEMK